MTNLAHIRLATVEPDSKAGHARFNSFSAFNGCGFSVSPPVASPPNTVPAGVVAPPRTGVPG